MVLGLSSLLNLLGLNSVVIDKLVANMSDVGSVLRSQLHFVVLRSFIELKINQLDVLVLLVCIAKA